MKIRTAIAARIDTAHSQCVVIFNTCISGSNESNLRSFLVVVVVGAFACVFVVNTQSASEGDPVSVLQRRDRYLANALSVEDMGSPLNSKLDADFLKLFSK